MSHGNHQERTEGLLLRTERLARAWRTACRLGPVAILPLLAVLGTAAEVPLHARIDQSVRQAEPGHPAPVASDAEFLRRLSIDLLGSIPASDEARQFLDDRSPDKRTALVLRLLDHPRYAVHMTHVFDVMFLERRNSDVIRQEDWEQYLFESFASNKPYDQLAREILAADGTDPKTAARGEVLPGAQRAIPIC